MTFGALPSYLQKYCNLPDLKHVQPLKVQTPHLHPKLNH